jgi:hypothetical protein
MYGSNNMKKSVVFNNQFAPKLGGQFELESGGQFAPELVVNLHWKVVVNLTGFSTLSHKVCKLKSLGFDFKVGAFCQI